MVFYVHTISSRESHELDSYCWGDLSPLRRQQIAAVSKGSGTKQTRFQRGLGGVGRQRPPINKRDLRIQLINSRWSLLTMRPCSQRHTVVRVSKAQRKNPERTCNARFKALPQLQLRKGKS